MEGLNEAILGVLVLIIGTVAGFVVDWIKKASKNLQLKTDNELFKSYIEKIEWSLTKAVNATDKTFVDILKEAGTWTKETGKEALRESVKTMKRLLGADAIQFIQDTYGDVTTYLENLIESKLKEREVEEEIISIPHFAIVGDDDENLE